MIEPAAVLWAGVGACVAGLLTTVTGVGGGVALVAVLSYYFTPQLVLALSGPVLLFGNVSRTVLFRQHLDRRTLRWFLAGSVPAALAAGLTLPRLPRSGLTTTIGIFLLGYVALRLLSRRLELPRFRLSLFLLVGLGAGIVSATVGTSGPFFAPFFEPHLRTKEKFVGTIACATTGTSLGKVIGYVGAGIYSLKVVPILFTAAAGMAIGIFVGGQLLHRVDDRTFSVLVLVAIGLSGIRMLIG